MLWGFGVMIMGFYFAWPQDKKAQRIIEEGRRVRGAAEEADFRARTLRRLI
jgi:hypothetical protein